MLSGLRTEYKIHRLDCYPRVLLVERMDWPLVGAETETQHSRNSS